MATDAQPAEERIRHLSDTQRRVLFRRMREHGMPPRALPIAARKRAGDEAVLTAAQRRLWVLERFEPNSRFTRTPLAVRVEGELDVDALRAALDAVCLRHEALRTTFEERGDEVVQRVHASLPAPFAVFDTTAAGAGALRAEFEDRGFDLAREAPLRAAVLRLSDRESIVLLVLHHIVADGWAIDVLVCDLSRAYEQVRADGGASLGPAPLQLADYAWWENEMRALGEDDDELAAFRRALSGAPDESTFPPDFARPAVRSSRAGLVSTTLDPAAAAALGELTARAGTTLFAVLLSCAAVVLRRFAGQTDLVIGTVAANRERAETLELVGMLANAVPIRVAVADDEPFGALLARTARAAAGALAGQRVPLERIADAAGARRNPATTPLFQVQLILQNANRAAFDVRGLRCTPLAPRSAGAMHDLTFVCTERPDGLLIDVEFAADVYRESSAAAIAEVFAATCRAVASDPDLAVGALARPPAAPLPASPAAPFPRADASFARWAASQPDAAAIVSAAGVLTYADVARRAAALAAALPKTARLVGVLVDDGTSAALAMVGVHRAGAAFVMLDPLAGGLRNDAVVADADVAVVVASSATRERAASLRRPVIVIDDLGAAEGEPAEPRLRDAGPEPCYVAYTSGSTGRPKGIVQNHRAFAQFLAWQSDAFRFEPGARVAMWSPFAFDACYTEVYGALASGAELHVADYAHRVDPAYVARWLGETAATYYLTVPSFLTLLLDELETGDALPALTDVAVSGESLSPGLVDRFRSLLPNARLHNLYGPTESILASHLRVERAYARGERVDVGSEIAGRTVLVLDDARRPLPAGALGEIAIVSEYLTDGYLGDEAATSARFVPAPGARSPLDRMYLTGDLGRRLPSGALEFVGRRDRQVKIRGCRVEPGEVECVLAENAAVAECAVVADASPAHEAALVAYVVAPGGVSAAELLAHARARLPAYAVPSAIVALDALPRTATGKIDRRALPFAAGAPGGRGGEAPVGETEERIARVWARVLRSDDVARDRNFFDCGGTSIAAVALHRALDAEFPGAFTLLDVFVHPTVAELAAALHAPAAETAGTDVARERARLRRAVPPARRGTRAAPADEQEVQPSRN
jgi:amino acid adenylation domain-containing protein